MRAVAVAVLLAACGHAPPPAPQGPDPVVRREIEQAELAEKQRRHDVARTHYEAAVAAAHDPKSIWFARREYAETLATWGEYGPAIRHYEAALAAHAEDAKAWHELGMLRFHEGDTTGAIAAFERSRALAPKDLRPYRELGIAHWKLAEQTKRKAGLARFARSDEANVEYARAEAVYKDMLRLELPDRVRKSVEWALVALASLQRGEPPPEPPKPPTP
jgi:tetratricopeptide (TPR) repeat protein